MSPAWQRQNLQALRSLLPALLLPLALAGLQGCTSSSPSSPAPPPTLADLAGAWVGSRTDPSGAAVSFSVGVDADGTVLLYGSDAELFTGTMAGDGSALSGTGTYTPPPPAGGAADSPLPSGLTATATDSTLVLTIPAMGTDSLTLTRESPPSGLLGAGSYDGTYATSSFLSPQEPKGDGRARITVQDGSLSGTESNAAGTALATMQGPLVQAIGGGYLYRSEHFSYTPGNPDLAPIEFRSVVVWFFSATAEHPNLFLLSSDEPGNHLAGIFAAVP